METSFETWLATTRLVRPVAQHSLVLLHRDWMYGFDCSKQTYTEALSRWRSKYTEPASLTRNEWSLNPGVKTRNKMCDLFQFTASACRCWFWLHVACCAEVFVDWPHITYKLQHPPPLVRKARVQDRLHAGFPRSWTHHKRFSYWK